MKEKNRNIFIHPLADVKSTNIGDFTKIWQYSVILEGAIIGSNCNINFSCLIENQVRLGNNVTVKSGVYLWNGIECEDDVFLGPNVVFTNDIYPRSKHYKLPVFTLIKKGASIGANSTILAGVTIGRYALTGIGSVITKDIPDYALYFGNPAIFKGWVDEEGNKLVQISNNIYKSPKTNNEYILLENNKIQPL